MTHLVVGTAGHIDHGKSALVRALTGTDPDRLKEEQVRGITIDLGFAHWQSEDVTVSFVDVPGHERFIKNMLAGAGGIDAVLFVVAADESVMPQTREHFDICRLLNVPDGIVVITKSDLVDLDTLELVRLEVRELTRGSFLDGAPMVAASSRTGAGLDDVRAALLHLVRRTRPRPADGLPRMAIDRVFSVKGFGTVATGTLVSGVIRTDDALELLPGGTPVKVRGLQVHGAHLDAATAGQRVAVNLAGVDSGDLARGVTLTAPGALPVSRVFDVRLDVLPHAKPIRHGARVRVHQGTAEWLGRIAISSFAGTHGGAAATFAEVRPGASAYVRLRLEREAVMTRGDRLVVRAYSPSLTIGGGTVLDPAPPRSGIRTERGRARFSALDAEDGTSADSAPAERAVWQFVEEAGLTGVPMAALVWRAGLAPTQASGVAQALASTGFAVRVADSLVSRGALDRLAADMLSMLADDHRSRPMSEGMPREEMRTRLCGRAAPGVFEHTLDALSGAGTIVARDRLALSDHRVSAPDQTAGALEAVAAVYRDAGLTPPDVSEIALPAGVRRESLSQAVLLLIRQKVLVKVDTLVFHREALAGLARGLAAARSQAGPEGIRLDVASFKARYGLTRKFAIPLLEYLDRERITRRMGDVRIVL